MGCDDLSVRSVASSLHTRTTVLPKGVYVGCRLISSVYSLHTRTTVLLKGVYLSVERLVG